MSAFFLILQITCIVLLFLLCFIVFVALLILFYPVKFKVIARKDEKAFVKCSLCWLFRALYFSFVLKENKSTTKLYIFGIPINLAEKSKNKKTVNKKKNDKQKKQNYSPASSKNKLNKLIKKFKNIYNIKNKSSVIKQTLNMAKSVLKSIRFKRFDIYFNFGFDNPYNTGIAAAFLSVLNPFLPKKIMYDADYEKSVFNANSYICGNLTICGVGFPIIMYILKLKNTEDTK